MREHTLPGPATSVHGYRIERLIGRAASLGKPVRVCVVATAIVTCLAGGVAHAQSGTDVSPAIPVHPNVPTILQLPERIERSWFHYGDGFKVKGVGSKVYVRPRRSTPAGTEALLEVKTRSLHRIFLLRVVARAEDARREVTVPAASAAECAEEAERDASTAAPTPAEPAARATTSTPGPAPAPVEPPPTAPEPASAPADERAPVTAASPGIDLSLHAVVGLGATALDLVGYEAGTGLQLHNALGVRLAGAPRGGWWELEADVSGERLAGLLTYRRTSGMSEIQVSGPWVRAMLGMRMRFGTRWMPSVYAGIGAQAHLRGSKALVGDRNPDSSTMKRGGVLALGMGLQYRVRDVLLGVEVRVWEGGPDEYRSIAALLSVGRLLDQGDAP